MDLYCIIKQGIWAAFVYFRRDNYSSVTIKDGIWYYHYMARGVATHCHVFVSQHNKYFRIENITISKAVSTFNIIPNEIHDVSHQFRFSSVHPSRTFLSQSWLLYIESTNSHCIFCLKTFMNRKFKMILHFVSRIEKILLFDYQKYPQTFNWKDFGLFSQISYLNP